MTDTSTSGTARPRLLLDCDPGHDDALAIVAAAHHGDLVGITTVAGNAALDRTTYNALVVRDLLGLDVPIHSGSAKPLIVDAAPAAFVHGDSGLDGADLPAPSTPLNGTDAIDFIVQTCRHEPGLWLVPTGPLTNVALAVSSAPDIVENIAGISLMGGGSFGNRTASAEFNIWADPHAADIVFGSGARLVMAGLDVTHRFQATDERIDRVRSVGGTLATVLADLLEFFSGTYRDRHDPEALAGAAMHDPLAVFAVTHPGLFVANDRHVRVETAPSATRGMTIIDERRLIERPAPNCRVLRDLDDDAAFDLLVDAISGART